MSSSEIEESTTVREVPPDGCQTPAELRRKEDGGDCQIPATRDGGDGQIPATRDGGECDASENVEDGYRTPTSPRHRILEALECPPAPKKPRKEIRLKRKRSLEALHVDPDEVESFLRQFIGGLLAEGGRKIRKVRGERRNNGN